MKGKKILTGLLAVCTVLGMCSGCGSQSGSSTPQQSASAAAPVESAAETAAATAAPAAASTNEEPAGLTLPLTEEPVTLTEWWGGFDSDQIGVADPSEVLVSQEAEKRTGIHVDYVTCGTSTAAEVGAIMYASGEYCDMIAGGTVTYTGGFEKGVEDGIYIELNDLIEEGYAPNYKAIMDSDPKVAKDAATDSGKYIAFWQISDNPQWPWFGILGRGDWLEELNLDTPKTYDQLHDVLKAFKEEKGAQYPLNMGQDGYGWFQNFLAGCGVSSSWMQKDGEVMYGPVQDGYRQYLEMMQQWFQEGLMNPDFMSVSMMDNSSIVSGQAGVFLGNYTDCDTYADLIPGSHVIGFPEPRLNENDEIHVGQVNARVSSKWVAISTACEVPELAAQWIDYFYSDEGMLLNNYGIENETFQYDAEGNIEFTDLITDNPDGLSFQMACWHYIDGGPGVRSYVWERELMVVSDDCKACEDAWSHDGAYMISDLVTPTAEESERQSGIMGDVETYVKEMTLKYITGQESLDNWDEYCNYIWGLGLQNAVDIEQDVLDRYNAR